MSDLQDKQSVESKKQAQLSTLQLWQAHLRALSRASNEKTHAVEVFDTTEQTSSTIEVNLPSNPAAPC
jgi:hypothetical protein